MVTSFDGCSFETIARNLQKANPALLIIMGQFLTIPGIERYIIDGSSIADISVPAVGMGVYPWVGLLKSVLAAYPKNESFSVNVVPDDDEFELLFQSPLMPLFQVMVVITCGYSVAVSGYKLFLFIESAKGIKLHISQIVLLIEFLSNLSTFLPLTSCILSHSPLVRFVWGIDPLHGAYNILPWPVIIWLKTLPTAVNCISIILISFYWMDLVNNSTGAKSSFLSNPISKAVCLSLGCTILGIEIWLDAQGSMYSAGGTWVLYICYFYIGLWFVIGSWFLYSGFSLVKALNKGKKGKEGGASKVCHYKN
jgi:hypothetical protein